MTDSAEPELTLEIVSHCWNYSRLLTYQLSSLVLYPPRDMQVIMSVFYNREDARTCSVLDYFEARQVGNVQWRWRHLDKPQLFRRAIGRNMVALDTEADWVWFNDCDQLFRDGCLDTLAAKLPTCTGPLVYPRVVQCTQMIDVDHPIFVNAETGPAVLDIDPADFYPVVHTKAIGALQIARADVLHEVGYCKDLPKFMRPARKFGRTNEDRAFRKLVGTSGEPIEVPEVYRIAHLPRGRRLLRPAKNL